MREGVTGVARALLGQSPAGHGKHFGFYSQ